MDRTLICKHSEECEKIYPGNWIICRHAFEHVQTPSCFIKCCDVNHKDVRCILYDVLS